MSTGFCTVNRQAVTVWTAREEGPRGYATAVTILLSESALLAIKSFCMRHNNDIKAGRMYCCASYTPEGKCNAQRILSLKSQREKRIIQTFPPAQ
jgi:hypothetical protein